MEIYTLHHDIALLCVASDSFPDGVMASHQKLHALLPSTEGRRFFGISYPTGLGKIIYKAAAEETTPGEAEKLGCETFVLPKGEYISVLITNFMDDIPGIGKTFQTLIADPRIDPNGFCVELYPNETDVLCMVPLDSSNR